MNRRLPRAALAKQVGVAEATLRTWSRKGLESDREGLVSLAELLAFCREHRSLPAARRILERHSEQSEPDTGQSHLDASMPVDAEGARAVARSARTATLEIFDALLRSARAAEDTARAHRETLEKLRVAFAAQDDALVQVTAPAVLHD